MRVLASVLPACAAQRIRPNPPLRFSSELLPCSPLVPLPATAQHSFLHAHRFRYAASLPSLYLALPALRRDDDRVAKIHCRGTMQMQFVRFFVGLPPAALLRRALARRSTRVRDSHQRDLSASSSRASALYFAQRVHHLPKLFAPSRHPANSFRGTKRPFNPHNSTRPPQPPAASF